MRRLATLILAAGLLATAAGCAPKQVPVKWTPTGGSRADATVEIGCIYDPRFEYAMTTQDLQAMAAERCRAWGYTDAQAFGDPLERCVARYAAPFGQVVCTEMHAKQSFQCIGQGNNQ